MSDVKVNDIVEVTQEIGGPKMARVLTVTPAIWGDVTSLQVEFFEDKSTLFVSSYTARKVSVTEVLSTKCPVCMDPWKRTVGFKDTYEDCLKCGKTKETIVSELKKEGRI